VSSRPWPGSSPLESAPTAVILPGTGYTAKAPLLYWTATLLSQHGWRVEAVEWSSRVFPDDPQEARTRIDGELQQAVEAVGGRVDLVVAKSIGTHALPWALDRGVAGVWLTPVLTDAGIVDGLTRASSAHLAAGGDRDPLWAPARRMVTEARLRTLDGADHSLVASGDWRRSLDLQREVFEAIETHVVGVGEAFRSR
jgi:hypothetical protein